MAGDSLTIGAGSAAPGGVANVPVYLRDVTGTPLDLATSNQIEGVAFKVTFPTNVVSGVTISRAGVLLQRQIVFDAARQGSGFVSYVVTCAISCVTARDAFNPGEQIATLAVTLRPDAPYGAAVTLRLDPPSAMLATASGAVRETVEAGTVTLANGMVTVGSLGPPDNLVATATSTSQVGVTWNAVATANHYEIWRSLDGKTFSLLGTPAVPNWTDSTVSAATTYLYKVRTVDSAGGLSTFTPLEPATTVVFTDNPLVVHSTVVKLVHVTELRTAVNAFRAAAGLAPLAADPTIAAGAVIRASHIDALNDGIVDARRELGIPLAIWSAGPLAGTVIAAEHVNVIRRNVQ